MIAPFTLHRPESLEEASSLLSEHGEEAPRRRSRRKRFQTTGRGVSSRFSPGLPRWFRNPPVATILI